MRVICIDGTKSENEFDSELPIEGEVYTVDRSEPGVDKKGDWVPCYKLIEIDRWLFDVKKFIPLTGNKTESIEDDRKIQVQEAMPM